MDEEVMVAEETNPEVRMVDDGMGGEIPAPAGDQGESGYDWDSLGPGAREFAEKSGFKTPDDLVRSYQELRSEFTRRSQELARIQEESVRQPPREAAPRAEEQPAGQINWADLEEISGGDIGVAMGLYHRNVVEPMLKQAVEAERQRIISEHVEPLTQVAGSVYWRQQANALEARYGDSFTSAAEDIARLMEERPHLAQDASGMEMAYEIVAGRKAIQAQARARASVPAGGRSGRSPAGDKPRDVAADVRAAIMATRPGGGLPDVIG